MAQQAYILSGPTAPDTAACTDAWALARKRADEYLKLNQLSEIERAHLLLKVSHKLARCAPRPDHELIRLFIREIQNELIPQPYPAADATACPASGGVLLRPAEGASLARARIRIKTGPQFQRSSVRVAPLQGISLRRARMRHPHSRHH